MNGSLEEIRIDKDKVHTSTDYFVAFDGIVKYLAYAHRERRQRSRTEMGFTVSSRQGVSRLAMAND